MRKLIYLLPFAIMALAGCMKGSSDSTPVPVPTGTFTGTFRILHKNASGGFDTTKKIPFTLQMSTSTGFKVTADTTTIHAGSYGDFAVNGFTATFIDQTYPKTGTPAKIHLHGYYPYVYDGTNFQFYTTFADTMAYVYWLKKTAP